MTGGSGTGEKEEQRKREEDENRKGKGILSLFTYLNSNHFEACFKKKVLVSVEVMHSSKSCRVHLEVLEQFSMQHEERNTNSSKQVICSRQNFTLTPRVFLGFR